MAEPGPRWRPSLRWRLTAAFAVAMAVVLAALGGFIYLQVGAELARQIDQSLGARADALTTAIGQDPTTRLGSEHRFADSDEAFAQLVDGSGRVVDGTPGFTQVSLVGPGDRPTTGAPRFLTRAATGSTDAERLLALPTTRAGQPVTLVVGATLGDRADALHHLLLVLAVGGPTALLLSGAVGWAVAGGALRPVERLRRRASDISQTDPHARLPVPPTRDELSRLALTLNGLLERMQAALEREHRFVDDASHELRTPLAVLKAELDLALSRPRTESELTATVLAAARETDRLVLLAEDLLVLARLRPGGLPLRPAATHLPALVADAVAPVQGLAAERGRRIRLDVADRSATVDPLRTAQAVQNLARNALEHGSGEVVVTVQVRPGEVGIEVRDEGPGIAASLGATAFEPFTRASVPGTAQPPDQPRGAGLGLAIVKAVADAHGGTAVAFSGRDGAGVRVVLRTPEPTADPAAATDQANATRSA
jgi:signal transduction histidine kinase